MLRELFVAPHIGQLAALLAEAPIMLGVICAVARWLPPRWAIPGSIEAGVMVGLFGFDLLVPTEIFGALLFRQVSLEAYLTGLATPVGLISSALFATFAAAPALAAWAASRQRSRE
jgi:hypothetical protein